MKFFNCDQRQLRTIQVNLVGRLNQGELRSTEANRGRKGSIEGIKTGHKTAIDVNKGQQWLTEVNRDVMRSTYVKTG